MTTAESQNTDEPLVVGTCPVSDTVWNGPDRPALAGYALLDELRSAGPILRLSQDKSWYLITEHEVVRRVAQDHEIFRQTRKLAGSDQEMAFELIPETLNGEDHTKWRRLLAPYFSPKRVASWDARIRSRAAALVDGLVDRHECDLVADFALRYPTAMFLDLMGLPHEDLDMMLAWETAILHPHFDDGPAAMALFERSQAEVMEYFVTAIADRRAQPRDRRPEGLVTEALDWRIDDGPVKDEDLLSFYMLMFLAGLDTVTAELGYGFLHLATHPRDRQRLVDDPSVIPRASEEMLRLYSIVNASREAAVDAQIAGCPVAKGEVIMLSFPSAGRDEAAFQDALRTDFDRGDGAHLAFGAGPHRCLGSHLARHEMIVAYEEWHKRIPEYRLKTGATYMEASGNMMTLNSLPLEWS
jgi:cytochrome P450